MKLDPEIDPFICHHCHIEPPLTFAKMKDAALSRGLDIIGYMSVYGARYVLSSRAMTPSYSTLGYKTQTAAYREGLVRWIITNGKILN
jgi:hypothetical protein